MPDSFFDSNVLLYLVSEDNEKADRAEAVLAAGGTISVQVLNEFVNVARRKKRLSWSETHEVLRVLRRFLEVVPVTVEIHDKGLALAERFGLPVYDAMIVAAARLCGCSTLWSEDMRDGLVIDRSLTIRNPFR